MAERLEAVLSAPDRGSSPPTSDLGSWIPALVCVGVHLTIVLPLAAVLGLGVDEAYSLHTSAHGVAHALDRALHFEMQPPAFFVLLAAWRTVSDGVLFARLLSVLFTSLAVLVAGRLSRRLFPNVPSGCLPAAAACNPMLVECAVNVRVYALVALLSGVLLLLFHDGFVSDRGGRRARILYVAASALALYSQYYLGFLLVANFAALVMMRRWRASGAYLLSMAVVAAALVPLLTVTQEQFADHTHTVRQTESLRSGLSTAARHAENLVLSQHKVSFGRALRWLVRLGVYATVGLGVVSLFRRRGVTGVSQRVAATRLVPLGAALAVVVLFFGVTATLVGKDLVALRHATGMLFPSLVFFYALFALGRPRLVAPLGTAGIVLASANALFAFYTPFGAFPPTKVMAEYVDAEEVKDEPVVVFPSDSALPFDLHYDGDNRIVPLPEAPSLVHYDIARFVLHDEAHVRAKLAEGLRGRRECWLVLFEAVDGMGVNVNAPLLEAVVRSHFTVLSTRRFEFATVRHLRQNRPLERP